MTYWNFSPHLMGLVHLRIVHLAEIEWNMVWLWSRMHCQPKHTSLHATFLWYNIPTGTELCNYRLKSFRTIWLSTCRIQPEVLKSSFSLVYKLVIAKYTLARSITNCDPRRPLKDLSLGFDAMLITAAQLQ